MVSQAFRDARRPRTKEPLVECYRSLATRLAHAPTADGTPFTSVGVTSAAAGEGVSTVASALAHTEATVGGKSVLLIDASTDDSHLARTPRHNGRAGNTNWAIAVDLGAVVESTECERLSTTAVSAEAIHRLGDTAPAQLHRLLSQARDSFDLVVVDLPSARSTGPCFAWAPLLDGIVLVVQAERTSIRAALEAKRRLLEAHSNLLGVVFNKRSA